MPTCQNFKKKFFCILKKLLNCKNIWIALGRKLDATDESGIDSQVIETLLLEKSSWKILKKIEIKYKFKIKLIN